MGRPERDVMGEQKESHTVKESNASAQLGYTTVRDTHSPYASNLPDCIRRDGPGSSLLNYQKQKSWLFSEKKETFSPVRVWYMSKELVRKCKVWSPNKEFLHKHNLNLSPSIYILWILWDIEWTETCAHAQGSFNIPSKLQSQTLTLLVHMWTSAECVWWTH